MQSEATIEVAKGLTEKALDILVHEIQETKRIQETLANEIENQANQLQQARNQVESLQKDNLNLQKEIAELQKELEYIKTGSAAGEEV